MRALFVYPNIQGQRRVQMGLASLAAYIKRGGHQAALFDTTFYDCRTEYPLIVEHLRRKIRDYNPDLLAVS